MKTNARSFLIPGLQQQCGAWWRCLLVLLITGLSAASAQDVSREALKQARSLLINPVGYFNDHHIEGVGLVLWGADAFTEKPGLIGQTRGKHDPAMPKSFPDPVLKTTTFQHSLNPLEEAIDRFVLVARLQNGLDVNEAKAQSATYQWISDAHAGNFWNVNAALILDWYFPEDFAKLLAYRPDNLAAHLRTGFAWDRVTAGSTTTTTDLREVFVGVGFHLFPVNTAELKRFQQQSEFQIGLSYKDNAVTNDSQWGVNLNMQPVFKGFLPFTVGENWLLKATDRNERDTQSLVPADGQSTLEKAPDIFYIKPNFTLKSVFSDFAKSGSVNPGNYQTDWGGRMGFSLLHDHLRISYLLSGVTPLERANNTFLFQEARIEYRPIPNFPLDFSVRYTRGKRAPSFVEENRVILAAGIKF